MTVLRSTCKLRSQWTPGEWVTVFWSLENVQVSSSNNISVTELRISCASMYQARKKQEVQKKKLLNLMSTEKMGELG